MELWAKDDGTALLQHSLEVLERGQELAIQLGVGGDLRIRALIACALHDLGKATTSFQRKVRGLQKDSFPHALASIPFVFAIEGLALGEPLLATGAVASHHSPLHSGLFSGFLGMPDYLEGVWGLLGELLEELLKLQGCCRTSLSEFLQAARRLTTEPLPGLMTRLHPRLKALPPQEFATVKTVLQVADWLASAHRGVTEIFLSPGDPAPERYVHMRGFILRRFQEQIRHRSQGLPSPLYLRAPTGSGKTEALLLWAQTSQAPRVIYLLPTQATTNAIYERLQEVYSAEAVGLAHSRSSLFLRSEYREEEGPGMRAVEETKVYDKVLLARAFAKPVVAATLDQLLLAPLHGRHWEEKLVFSRKAAVIVDEVHTYEPFTLGLLLESLKTWPFERLAFASATLPEPLLELLREYLGEGTLIEAERPLWEKRRHRLFLHNGTLMETLERIISAARAGKQVLVVVNTVSRAQELYKRLRADFAYEPLLLLHSRFILRDRLARERQLRGAPQGAILIATQVVEVSLDISYDVLFTELAPLDALVQRLGRVNRFGEASHPAPVHIFLRVAQDSERVYREREYGLLERTRKLLHTLPEIPNDSEMLQATTALYQEILPTPSFQRDLAKGAENLHYVQSTLGAYTIDLGEAELRERFLTRTGLPRIDVIPEEYLSRAQALLERGEGWRLPELLVPIPLWWAEGRIVEMLRPWAPVAAIPYDPNLGAFPPEGLEEALFLE